MTHVPETFMVLAEVAEERRRQIEKGYDADHDDQRTGDELALAGACYASREPLFQVSFVREMGSHPFKLAWPFTEQEDNRETYSYRRRLVIAAAFLVAEAERVDRYMNEASANVDA